MYMYVLYDRRKEYFISKLKRRQDPEKMANEEDNMKGNKHRSKLTLLHIGIVEFLCKLWTFISLQVNIAQQQQ